MNIQRIERGWAGHFTCADYCRFRRNTLVSSGDRHIVVSTVGNMRPPDKVIVPGIQPIGLNRYYETMAFIGERVGPYIDASVSNECRLNPNVPWSICADSPNKLSDDVDNVANDMHERHVDYVIAAFDSVYNSGLKKEEDEKDA